MTNRLIRNFLTALALFAVCCCFADGRLVAQDITNPKGDFGKELPRVPALTPEQSRQAIEMAEGFHVELVASEPLVRDPVAVDFDEQGRMYVVQLPPYNAYVLKDFETPGSIVQLADSDEDGIYETRKEFAAELHYPTAIACWDGGVFVGDAPDLLYLKDTDDDGRADVRRVVLTGFGKDKAGEAHLNSMRWGTDNRFHLSTSLSGGEIHSPDKKTKPVSVRNRGIIFDPRSETFQLTSGGGQHGMSMDDWGRKFVCSNSVPAQTLMYDDRYVVRNPQLKATPPPVDIAPDKKYTKLYRITPPEPWRVLRTRLRKEGKFRGSDEGGTPFGFFTGATGITIYRGDAWPESHYGNLIVGDVANNLVYRAKLESDGISVVARRADADAEFLASRDIWFRPVQFANTPDGTLYVLDMNRELIEGAAFLPPEFLKHIDAASGSDRGRIYRIAPDAKKLRTGNPRLGEMTTSELAVLLDHPNGWHRDTASRLLYQRQDRHAEAQLRKVVAEAKRPQARVAAIGSLHGLGLLEAETVAEALRDSSPQVRAAALQWSERLMDNSPLLREEVPKLVSDAELLVRYQLAFTLGSLRTNASLAALAKLAVDDGQNPWMQLAVLSSLHRGADVVFQSLAEQTQWRRTAHGKRWLVALASQIAAAPNGSGWAAVLRAVSNELAGDHPMDKSLVDAVVKSLLEKQSADRRAQILAAAGGKANDVIQAILKESQSRAANQGLAVEIRVAAIEGLRLGEFEGQREVLTALLKPTQPQQVQQATLMALSAFSHDEVADELLGAWPRLSPTLRAQTAEILLSRPLWIKKFLDQVEADKIARSEISAARVQLLRKHPDTNLAQRVEKLFGETRVDNRKAVVDRYQPALKAAGQAVRGKLVFKKNCSACHKLDGVGEAVGADLKGIAQRGLPSVLLNVLDPNREVKPQFLSYVIQTEDGRVLTGMIAGESANNITLRQTDGRNVPIQRVDIARMRSTGLSFMPEGLEKEITVEAMADLLQFLSEHSN